MRNHAEEFKQAMIAACCEVGASVAGIALANEINTNQVRRWMREGGMESPSCSLAVRSISAERGAEPAIVPVQIPPLAAKSPDIRIEVRRGNTDKAQLVNGLAEAGCMAHARRKFFDQHSQRQGLIAGDALEYFGKLYGVEREVVELDADERRRIREVKARPVADQLHAWLTRQRQVVANGSATARVIDYSLKRWVVLTHYLPDAQVPIDNNWIEYQIRPIALGRKNWLFAGSLRTGKRAAAMMSLLQPAKLNGHEPLACLKDVLTRLPIQPASRVRELLPHRWQPQTLV